MDQSLFTYDIVAEDPGTHARAGVLHTPHGDVPTPIFMPVGTKATVKGLMPSTLRELGTKILLANTYHLSMRPGADLVAEMGGLHDFMRWDGPILTDSGGFQVFSHEEFCKLSDDGVRFRAVDYDGKWVSWTPEDNMDIAQKLGADIVMQLDQCVGYPAPRRKVERSVELSSRWAERCYAAHTCPDQALFGIVQGGMHLDLRLRSLRHLEEVLKALSSYEFVRAVNALEKAENISVYAVENSSCTAEDFATKMTYIGKQVYFNKDGYMQKVNAKNLTERDVAMGISHTGQSRHTVDALRCAKESGAMTIAITNYQQALINKYADIILCTENTQYMYGNAIFSRSAQISLVDMLYLGVFLKNYDYYAEKLNNSWKNIQDLVYERDSRF